MRPSCAACSPGTAPASYPQGAWLKFYFGGDLGYPGIGGPNGRGMPFGLPPTEKALDAYLEMMEGCDIPWGVSAVGGDVVECGIAELALERGGHIHVGLEMFAGERQPTNVELVEEVVELCKQSRPGTPALGRLCVVSGVSTWLGRDSRV